MLALTTLLAAAAVAPASADAAVRATQLETFSQPVYLTSPPEDPHRLFVLEKEGYVRVLRDGVKLSEPFLDIHTDVISGGEQGLLSMAFAPDYRTSGKFYVYYTTPAERNNDIIVDEFTVSTDADRADPTTRRRLLSIPHRAASNHDGGQLMFGPDGFLYITTGDGGSANDPPNNAQNLDVLLGKILRIDPRNGNPYAIPPGNPYAAPGDGARDEIWAYGLRNPFRASFDRATGDLTIADVGQNRAEEIDFSPRGTDAGANYGWRCYEGFERTTNACDASQLAGYVEPVLEQVHATSGFCAIIGGYVVRDPALSDLTGRYVYGDNCAPQLRSAVLQKPRAADDRPVGLSIDGLSSFGEDSCGHVYATSLRGPVYRLDGDTPPAPCPEPGPLPDTTAPTVGVSRRRAQRALRQKGFIVSVRCNEDCGFTAGGRMRVSGSRKRYGLRKVSRLADGGRSVRVRLTLSKKGTAILRRTLARRKRASVTVSVEARDSAGNSTSRKATIRARR